MVREKRYCITRHTKSSNKKITKTNNKKKQRREVHEKEFQELHERQNSRCIITGMNLGERHEYVIEHLLPFSYSHNDENENLNLMSHNAHSFKTKQMDDKIKDLFLKKILNEQDLYFRRYYIISIIRYNYTINLLLRDNNYLIEKLSELKILYNYYIEEFKNPNFSWCTIYTLILENLQLKIDELDKINLDNLSNEIEDDFNNFFEKLNNVKALLNE
jgi:hypothetical protein